MFRIRITLMWIRIQLFTLMRDADPVSIFLIDADAGPAPHESDASLRQLVSDPPLSSILHIHASIVSVPALQGFILMWTKIRMFILMRFRLPTMMRIWKHSRDKVSKLFF